MGLYAVQYEYSADEAPDRQRVRPDHAAYLKELDTKQLLVLSGPYTDGTGALLMVRGDSEEGCRRLLDSDPFWMAGLVRGRRISQFSVGFGLPAESDRVIPPTTTR